MAEIADNAETLLAETIKTVRSSRFEQAFNDWLQCCVPYDNITTLAYFQDRRPERLMFESLQPKVHENIDTVYLAGAYLLDPFHDLHIRRAPRDVYRLSEIAPDQFNRNRYFNEYYRNTTMVDEIAFVCYPSEGVSIHVCLGRDSNSKLRFSNRNLAAAARNAPIVASLVETHWDNMDSTGTYAETDVIAMLIEAAQQAHDISLSPRQAEVAMLILQGHSSVSIGLRLGISFQTVKVFRKQLYKKCEISSQAELFTLLLPLLGG